MVAQPAVRVIGVDHVVINSTDIERSIAWYCDELGLAPERVDEWRRGEVLFPSARVDATTIIDLFPAERTGENVNHVCLVVAPTDLDALVARFAGSHRADGLYGAQGIASSVYVHDPDGNTVELRSYE
ncbi:MAG TPA: VOC family protein [Acidimicrobiia bacterium]|nr:VOC family protein [Acidimicrobiia bacterium]